MGSESLRVHSERNGNTQSRFETPYFVERKRAGYDLFGVSFFRSIFLPRICSMFRFSVVSS